MPYPHLAHVPTDVHSLALGETLWGLYQAQSGERPSGHLKGQRKGQGVMATVTRDGAWRIVDDNWQQGTLPEKLIEEALRRVASYGKTPYRDQLVAVIVESTKLAKLPENQRKRKRRTRSARRGAKENIRT